MHSFPQPHGWMQSHALAHVDTVLSSLDGQQADFVSEFIFSSFTPADARTSKPLQLPY